MSLFYCGALQTAVVLRVDCRRESMFEQLLLRPHARASLICSHAGEEEFVSKTNRCWVANVSNRTNCCTQTEWSSHLSRVLTGPSWTDLFTMLLRAINATIRRHSKYRTYGSCPADECPRNVCPQNDIGARDLIERLFQIHRHNH